jgi:hypothetical protein
MTKGGYLAMKIVGWLMILVLLFSVLFFPACGAPQEEEPIRSLNLSPTAATNNITTRCELIATVTEDGVPVPGVAVRFEFDASGCHYPANLAGNESYWREVCEWVESPLICEGEHCSPLISDHWKKEKVYSTTLEYVYCVTGDNGEAKFAYNGIKACTDVIMVSANVCGHEVEAAANITWLG